MTATPESTHKTRIEEMHVSGFLEKRFGGAIPSLTFIEGGEGSQAFSFETGGKDLILRVNTESWSFGKDSYAHTHFSAGVPIPEIIEMGQLDEKYHYAISERAAGRRLDTLRPEEYRVVVPKLLRVLDAIHVADVSATSGYGQWDGKGVGEMGSWREYLKSVNRWAEPAHGPGLFETSFLERDVWEPAYAELLRLIPYCSEERALVHGDFGFDNAFSDGKDITAVIDWGSGKYGDPLYDAAWLCFWTQSPEFREFV